MAEYNYFCRKVNKVLSVAVKERPARINITVDSVKASFPKDLASKLSFEDKGDKIVLKPIKRLRPKTFAKIDAVVKALDGVYMGAGKESHFKILK